MANCSYALENGEVILDSKMYILEFCIIADLSKEAEEHTLNFLRKFIIEGLSDVEMEEQIRHYEEKVGMQNSDSHEL